MKEIVQKSDESLDAVGRFKIIQKKEGHRFTADSILLSEFVLPVKADDVIMDIGTASGIIPMLILKRSAPQKIIGVEVQDELAELAKRNIALNRLSEKFELLKMDYRELKRKIEKGSFDLIVSNPPYIKSGCGRVSPNRLRAVSRTEIIGSLIELVEVSAYLIKKRGGRICYMYPVTRVKEVAKIIEMNGLHINRLCFVYTKKRDKAELFMIEASYRRNGPVIERPILLQ